MPTVRLDDRAVISVTGPDVEHLLQNILTTDLDALETGTAKPGALLTPQGKILFDFLISRDGAEGFALDCRADIADDLLRRLTLYKLRAKVTISKQDQGPVTISWRDGTAPSPIDSGTSQTDSAAPRDAAEGLVDLRFPPSMGVRRLRRADIAADAPADAWTRLRIGRGVAESGTDYALGDAFPHDANLDQIGGVGMRKGCYVGQEVVSRMQHRGTARRRVLLIDADAALPPPGTAVTIEGRPVGTLGSTLDRQGLAILRIDKVADGARAGLPLMAGAVAVRAALPPDAGFGFPQDAAADGA